MVDIFRKSKEIERVERMYKRVLRESLPTIIAATLNSMYAVIDGLFIGKSSGDVGLAAINIAWPLSAIIAAIGIGIGTGGSILLSNYLGNSDDERAKNTYGTTLSLLGIASIIMFVLLYRYEFFLELLGAKGEVLVEAEKYARIITRGCFVQVIGIGVLPLLRNLGMAIPAMYCMITGLLLNIGINYYLMMVQGMGIVGAAYGTIIAQSTVVVIAMICLLLKGRYKIVLSFKRNLISRIIGSGITPLGVYLAPSITLIFTNLQCLKYGGDAVVACYAVIAYIAMPVQSMLAGIGDGTQPLLSYYYGANEPEKIQSVKKISYTLVGIGSLLAMVITIVLVNKIGVWFGLSEEGSNYFVVGMIISAVAYFGQAFNRYNISFLNATLYAKQAVTLTYIESLAMTPILLFVLPYIWGVNGIWLSPLISSLIMIGIYQLKFRK